MEFDVKYKCTKCGEVFIEEELFCFGNFDETKKLWCEPCWKNLQEWIKEKKLNETIPDLRNKANELLVDCDKNKKQFIEIIKQTKSYLTRLDKLLPKQSIENFSKQTNLNLNITKNGAKQ